MTLMGFKPRSALKDYHNIKPPYFIYPDESTMKGSTVAFAALLHQMAAKGKIAICRLIYRKGVVPKFVALLPQEEKVNGDGEITQYPGMHMIFLPFADDVRQLKFEPTPIAEPDLIVKAKQVIQSMPAKFDNSTFENPSLQKHYAIIQALALDENIPEDVDDLTMPDYERMQKFGPVIKSFADACNIGPADLGDAGGDGSDDEGKSSSSSSRSKSSSSRKRKEPDSKSDKGGASKRAKKEHVEDASAVDWKAAAQSGKLKKMTIPELKVYLKANGLPVSGKKELLLERILGHLGV
jgi:ATP-dependent DNA helicase 2 subunit 1